MITLLRIVRRMQQQKNFKNRLIFGEDTNNHTVGRFWATVYIE